MKLFSTLKAMLGSAPRVAPRDCAERIRAGRACLIDVREPAEWRGGVIEGAVLLPLSDLAGARAQWKPFLQSAAGRELVCYCAVGGRAGRAAALLAAEGFSAVNGGGFAEWRDAGGRVVAPGGTG